MSEFLFQLRCLLACKFIKEETLAQVFSCKLGKIFKKALFYRIHPDDCFRTGKKVLYSCYYSFQTGVKIFLHNLVCMSLLYIYSLHSKPYVVQNRKFIINLVSNYGDTRVAGEGKILDFSTPKSLENAFSGIFTYLKINLKIL